MLLHLLYLRMPEQELSSPSPPKCANLGTTLARLFSANLSLVLPMLRLVSSSTTTADHTLPRLLSDLQDLY